MSKTNKQTLVTRGRLFLTTLILFFSISAFGQSISNEGLDFWAVFPSHVPSSSDARLAAQIVLFVTSKETTEVRVTCGSFDKLVKIEPNIAVPIEVPRADSYVDIYEADRVLTNRGIHVAVTPGKPKVAVYAHIYAGNRSAASLILPFDALGQKYFSANYTQTSSSGRNFLTLVGVMDNSRLIIKRKDGTEEPPIDLNAGDVYEYTSGLSDLTGVSVYVDPTSPTASCTRFAAFSGSSTIVIEDCHPINSSADPLYQQVYPISSLGKSYGIVPFFGQSYLYRAIATEPDTKIYQDGVLVTTLVNAGDFYPSDRLNDATLVTADKKILVSQYMYSVACASSSGGHAGNGDADMVLLNPVEFNVNNITVFSSGKENIFEKFLNILIKTDRTATFKINGTAPAATWTPLAGNPLYSYAQIQVTDEHLTLSADVGFNAIAYGYGRTESYAYSAGTNLAANNYLTVVNTESDEKGPDGCVGVPVALRITLPYPASSIDWTLDDGVPQSLLDPEEPIRQADGTYLYVYNSPFPVAAYPQGKHKVEVSAPASDVDLCITIDPNIKYQFTIYDLPVAGFTTDVTAACVNGDVKFTSIPDPSGIVISNWYWDFGDGTPSVDEANPIHQYANEGNYQATLLVKSVNGCLSDPIPKQTLQIHPLPQSDFILPTNGCKNTAVVIADNSEISTAVFPASKIVEWTWDFGDGTAPEVRTDKLPFVHVFADKGTYFVTLTTKSSEGCETTSSSKRIIINDLPVANFTLPDVCFADASATFTNTSTDASDGRGVLSYQWDFGDVNATAANPNTSNAPTGRHQYNTAGTYVVTLTVINSNGCQSVSTQNFTVNGRVDLADFTVRNEADLCSNNDVIITNGFTALSGRIVKLEIYQDAARHPGTISKTVMYPKDNEEIPLTYEGFGGNEDEKFTIRIVAFTGDNSDCSKDISKEITLKPAPQVVFNDLVPVCEADGSVSVALASETTGIVGNEAYTSDGRGLAPDGRFNPKVAGAGFHNITYTFTAYNGCSTSITKTIEVYKSPLADAGETLYILSGDKITIPAKASGEDLLYQWAPALNLETSDVLNPVASPDIDTEYTLTVTTQPNGCTATSKVLVKVLQLVKPPNAFTPNGDNVNDVWQIANLESYPNATVEVFTRNGSKVFFSNRYAVPFDGNYQNEPLPVGVYYYVINPGNGRKTITGSLTIIR
ncbi:PKD domain-containing protein [Pedobacter endophyticus]|uniref:PKD domain-containing protein n=1 Tax=Pedobacter endophyticus TaxID=2789740 RepID=A0A7S9KZJ6_9SPHI|nr:PKD domain-containing protein [Pedobacter endophyticus]QPH39736.1 PKD domain-containing protein [Pedobacter endophyticus]